MRAAIFRAVVTGISAVAFYHIYETDARADDWGCQVLLCISNPGGPTEFLQCRPPITMLWKELAKGRSFPTCTGVGFKASRPGYEPYFCDTGYRLSYRHGDRGQEVACISVAPQKVGNGMCSSVFDRGQARQGRWYQDGGSRVCKAIITKQPHVRERPRFVDVTIDGVGHQRVWF